ncbi:MAG: RNA methyltransferase, partial [Deltaproteobacteria bacterium]|nr:RNA methyltransferase [Deltaproteobacteria bacterium]
MAEALYQIRQCVQPGCNFRFPVQVGSGQGQTCPMCAGETRIVEAPFPDHTVKPGSGLPTGPEVEVLLENLRSIYNVGSIFRTSDAAGIRHIHLCGFTPTPSHHRLAKTALGAHTSVPWTQHMDGLSAAVSLKEKGLRLWALEGGQRSETLFDTAADLKGSPIALVLGNEISGVDPGILKECERVVSIPMQGIKTSLNVAVAFGIA